MWTRIRSLVRGLGSRSKERDMEELRFHLEARAGRTMDGFLFGVVPYDPLTLVTLVIVMGGVSTMVGFLPARRAARVNPIETLRYE